MEGQQLKAWQVADRLVSDMRSLNFETKRNGDAMAELLLPNLVISALTTWGTNVLRRNMAA